MVGRRCSCKLRTSYRDRRARGLSDPACGCSGAETSRRYRRPPTTVQDHLYAVPLVVNATPHRTCTGTPVAGGWVLAAAHCADDVAVGEDSWDSELVVMLG